MNKDLESLKLERQLEEPMTYIERNGVYYEIPEFVKKELDLVKGLRRVLSKVTRVGYELVKKENVYQPTMDIEYKIAEDFDVETFKNIIDQLGYELVKKENKYDK